MALIEPHPEALKLCEKFLPIYANWHVIRKVLSYLFGLG